MQGVGGSLPSWLLHSDVDRAPPLLNTLTQHLWPYIERAAAKFALQDRRLETLLNATSFWRPAWLARSGVRLAGVSLGAVPPKVTAIKVHRPDAEGGSMVDQVSLESDFVWDSKLEGEWLAAACTRSVQLWREPEAIRFACSSALHDSAARCPHFEEFALVCQHHRGERCFSAARPGPVQPTPTDSRPALACRSA